MCVFFHRKKVELSDFLSIWCGVWNRGVPALMILWVLMLPPVDLEWDFWIYVPDHPILLPAVWEGKEIIVIVKHPQLFTDLLNPLSRLLWILISLDPAEEWWLSVWPCIYIISWDTEVTFVNIVFICCWNRRPEEEVPQKFFSMGNRVMGAIKHCYGGCLWLKPLFHIWKGVE